MPLFGRLWTLPAAGTALLWTLAVLPATAAEPAPASPPGRFWPLDAWVKAAPLEENLSEGKLEEALGFARDYQSRGVVVVRGGRLVAERYWKEWNENSVQHIASVTKSVVAVLTGMAVEDGFLKGPDQKVSEILTEWKSSPKEGITVGHLLSMTSGLDDGKKRGTKRERRFDEETFNLALPLRHPPGTVWQYNSAAYRLLFTVLARATGKTLADYTKEKLLLPLGMKHTRWVVRKTEAAGHPLYLECSCRDLARFGLLVLRRGEWNGEQIVSKTFIAQATSRSQDLNEAYGFLWWLNSGRSFLHTSGRRKKRKGALFPDCPRDTVAALGAGDKKLYVVPSLDLVVVRLGDPARTTRKSPVAMPRTEFNNAFLSRICLSVQGFQPPEKPPPPPPPRDHPGVEKIRAKLAELTVARRMGDIQTFRQCAAEIQDLWNALPPEVQKDLERQYPGLTARIESGFE
jgi:CubicO group peptidase (beta-lactamase class C family)